MLKESSFFSCIKGYFDASYAGRYDEIILREVSQECPAIMSALYNDYDSSKHEIRIEYEYKKKVKAQKGKKGEKGRRADIAILEEGKVCCLIEIKVDDAPLKKQLEDYVAYSNKYKVDFIYLTQRNPSKSDLELIKKGALCKHIFFYDLYNQIKKTASVCKNPVGKLYIKYLEDNGNMFKKINPAGVEKLLIRLFLQWGGHGHVRNTKDMVETIPATFKDLMNNLYLLNEDIGKKIDCQMTVDYSFFPYIKIDCEKCKEKKCKDKICITSNKVCIDSDKICRKTKDLKAGGELWLYASGSFSENKSVVLEYGLGLKADSSKKQKFFYKLYAGVYLKADSIDNGYEEMSITVKQMSDKNVCIKKLKDLLTSVLEEAKNNKDVKHVKARIKRSLKNLE